VAEQLTAHDALAAMPRSSSLVPGELTSPWQAAAASALSFTLGALVPLLAILLLATDRKIPGTVMLAAVALA
jgi:VIT1/CCC1 family predicted Fe2+/Mn2+ transporter